MSVEILEKVRFITDCDGFVEGTVMEFEHGVADAYVNWRRSAEYVTDPPIADGPPASKVMTAAHPKLKRKGKVYPTSLAGE